MIIWLFWATLFHVVQNLTFFFLQEAVRSQQIWCTEKGREHFCSWVILDCKGVVSACRPSTSLLCIFISQHRWWPSCHRTSLGGGRVSPCVSLSLQCLMAVFSALLQLDRGAVVHSNEQVRPSGRSRLICAGRRSHRRVSGMSLRPSLFSSYLFMHVFFFFYLFAVN